MSQAKSTSRSHAPTSWTDPKRPFPKAVTAGPASSQTRLPSNDGGASKSAMTSRAAQGSASSINQSSAGLGRTGTVRKPSIWAKIMGDNNTQTRPVQPVQGDRDRFNSTLRVMPQTAIKASATPNGHDRPGQYANANTRSTHQSIIFSCPSRLRHVRRSSDVYFGVTIYGLASSISVFS